MGSIDLIDIECDNNCNNNGQCDITTGQCNCNKGYYGYTCKEIRQLRSCPGDGSCSNHGKCDSTAGSCICNPGFEGTQCEG
jgi:hypothetical protein